MEGSNVQVLIHEREWGLGEEIDHLLILANLAGEHCLSVRRDGQNDWLPVAAGSLALISTLHLILNRCLAYSSRVCYFVSSSLSQGLTQTPPCLTTNRWFCLLQKRTAKAWALKAVKIWLSSAWQFQGSPASPPISRLTFLPAFLSFLGWLPLVSLRTRLY